MVPTWVTLALVNENFKNDKIHNSHVQVGGDPREITGSVIDTRVVNYLCKSEHTTVDFMGMLDRKIENLLLTLGFEGRYPLRKMAVQLPSFPSN